MRIEIFCIASLLLRATCSPYVSYISSSREYDCIEDGNKFLYGRRCCSGSNPVRAPKLGSGLFCVQRNCFKEGEYCIPWDQEEICCPGTLCKSIDGPYGQYACKSISTEAPFVTFAPSVPTPSSSMTQPQSSSPAPAMTTLAPASVVASTATVAATLAVSSTGTATSIAFSTQAPATATLAVTSTMAPNTAPALPTTTFPAQTTTITAQGTTTSTPMDTTAVPITTSFVQKTTTPLPLTSTSALTSRTLEASTATAIPGGDCGGLGNIVRKEVKSLTQSEWDDYVRAFNILAQTPEPGGSGRSVYEQFAADHDSLATGANGFHGNEYFLAWHREMLWKWDIALNAAVPGVTQPYFEWSVSADAIFEDPMFAPNRFGGSEAQTGEAEAPIPNGSFQGLRSSWPAPHAVTRNFNMDPLATNQLIDSIIQGVDGFVDFTVSLEFGVHNAFHRAIGGDMVTPWSPNEPLFYFHHAYMDLLYRKWENRAGIDTTFSPETDVNRPMVPWSESTIEATSGAAKRCVSYEGLDLSARFDVVDRQSMGDSGVKFRRASDKVDALEVVAKKKIADPSSYKKTAERWKRARAAAAEAAVLLRQDLSKLAKAQKIVDTLLLKDGVVDMTEVDDVASESEEEVKAGGVEELAFLTSSGKLPDHVSTEDIEIVDS